MSANNDIECIICMDNTKETLITNTYCDCKIKWHNSCWDKYLKSISPPKCPTCRKQLYPLEQPLLPPASAPTLNTSGLQQITSLEQVNIRDTLNAVQNIIQELMDEYTRQQEQTYQGQQQLQQGQQQEQQEQQEYQEIQAETNTTRRFSELNPQDKKKRILQALFLTLLLGAISFVIIYLSI